jgi:ABC-type nitrate/sulfonate/bicarbonate transport system substrate-binding protein
MASGRPFLSVAALVTALAAAPLRPVDAAPPTEVRLDFSAASPSSLVIRKFGWAEQEFAKIGARVLWVPSTGSRHALELLATNEVDLGSAAGLAAVVAKANGNPLRAVCVTWVEFDPRASAAEPDAGAQASHRDAGILEYGVLHTTEKFAAEQPEAVSRVIRLYERARAWIRSHPDEAAAILAEAARMPPAAARRHLERVHIGDAALVTEHAAALKAGAQVLADAALLAPGTDIVRIVDRLLSLDKPFKAYVPANGSNPILAALH